MEITEADIKRMQASPEGITDPRRKWGNLRHKPEDMPVIALSRIIIGENDFESMEDWGREREEWFRGFPELPNGIPDKDTFRRLFEWLNPTELPGALTRWLSPVKEAGAWEVNIDGKTIGGAGRRGAMKPCRW